MKFEFFLRVIRKLDLDIWDHDAYVKASSGSTLQSSNNGLIISDDLGRKSGIFWASKQIRFKKRFWHFFLKCRKSMSRSKISLWYHSKSIKHIRNMFVRCWLEWRFRKNEFFFLKDFIKEFPYCIVPSTRSLARFLTVDSIVSTRRLDSPYKVFFTFMIYYKSTPLNDAVDSVTLFHRLDWFGLNPLHWFVDSPFNWSAESISLSRQVDKIELTSRYSRVDTIKSTNRYNRVDESIQSSRRVDTIRSTSQSNRVDESIKSIQWVDTFESTSQYNRVDKSI